MATSQTAQTALSSVATRAKRATPQSTVAVLQAQQDQSQERMQKLIDTITKLQQENAEEVKRAAQAGGGAATQVANQITQGLERARDEKQRATERTEDKEFAVQQQELNAKLQKDAARQAAEMGAAISASRAKYVNGINTLRENQEKVRASTTGFDARIMEMHRAGKFASPEGRVRLKKMRDLVKQAKVFGDNMFNDKHKRAGLRAFNEELASVVDSDDPFSILNAQTDPINLPMVEMKGPRDQISKLSDLTPDQQFKLELMDGYPPGGVMLNQEENFGLPEGEVPNVLHPATLIDLLSYDAMEGLLTDESIRQEFRTKAIKGLIENNDVIERTLETYASLNKTFNQKALAGTEAALEDFLTDNDPAKFNDVGRYIMTRTLKHTFGGGARGEEITQIALEFFDGKREPKSEHDFAMLMAVESASFNALNHFTNSVQSAADPAKGGSFATQLVAQSVERIGRDNTLRRLGVDPSAGAAIVEAQSVMQDLIFETMGSLSSMNEGMKSMSIYKQFKEKVISNRQQIDLHVFRMADDGTQREARLGELVADLNRPQEEGGPSLTQLQEGQERRKEFTPTKTMLESVLGLYGDLSPNLHEQISGLIVDNLDPVTSLDLKGYADQTAIERERSGYAKASIDRTLFSGERQKRGKARAALEKGGQAAGQSFKKGGVPQAIAETLPALLTMGGKAFGGVVAGTALVGAQLLGGEKLTRPFPAAAGAARGQLPLPFPGETARIKENLTPEEIQQIIRESNRGN